jgi:hypothetical protein
LHYALFVLFLCSFASDSTFDIKNGVLGINRDAFLRLISLMGYDDEKKLREV